MLCKYYSKVPKPLEENKLFELFQKYSKGDKESFNELVLHNLCLVKHIMKLNFKNYEYDKEDIFYTGIIGLIKAIQTFDLEKNIKFSTYAGRCIMNEILMFIRKNKKYQNDIGFEEIIFEDEKGGSFSCKDFLMDTRMNIENDFVKKETFNHIRELVEAIANERDKMIVKMNFGFLDGKIYSQKEIAKIFLISQSGVSKIIKKYLENIAWILYGSKEIDDISIQFLGKKEPLTFYEFLDCTKEEFFMISSMLSDSEKELLYIRHGQSLEHFNQNLKMTDDAKKNYFRVVNKCRRLLKAERSRLMSERIFRESPNNNMEFNQTRSLLEAEKFDIDKVLIRR